MSQFPETWTESTQGIAIFQRLYFRWLPKTVNCEWKIIWYKSLIVNNLWAITMKTCLVFTIRDQINDYNYPHTKCTKKAYGVRHLRWKMSVTNVGRDDADVPVHFPGHEIIVPHGKIIILIVVHIGSYL